MMDDDAVVKSRIALTLKSLEIVEGEFIAVNQGGCQMDKILQSCFLGGCSVVDLGTFSGAAKDLGSKIIVAYNNYPTEVSSTWKAKIKAWFKRGNQLIVVGSPPQLGEWVSLLGAPIKVKETQFGLCVTAKPQKAKAKDKPAKDE